MRMRIENNPGIGRYEDIGIRQTVAGTERNAPAAAVQRTGTAEVGRSHVDFAGTEYIRRLVERARNINVEEPPYKIDKIRKAIMAGTYNIDTEEVAKRIMREFFRRLGA